MRKLLSKFSFVYILTLIFILVLPYYLFEGKLYIGGDDTRLQYIYPEIYLKYVIPFSWNRFASLGWSIASQFYLPFLIIWSVVKSIIGNITVLNYLAFSTPLIIGFIYFQKLLNELIEEKKSQFEKYIGTLFYIFSPILIYDQLFVFLSSVWFIGLIPLVFYYFIKYLKTGRFINVFKASLASLAFSMIIFSLPWILGFLLPMIVSIIIVLFLFSRKEIIYGIKKFVIFFGIIGLTQSFWVLGYAISYINVSSNSFAAKIFSKGFQDTFAPTILSSATGDILNPLLNLFHRQMAFDFDWQLKNTFLNFYDKTLIINGIFLIVLFLGLVNFKRFSKKSEKKVFLYFLVSLIFSLYFFTVNIGPLKNLFLILGKMPLFTMFRNFSDKFSLGFVIIFSIVITFSLIFIKRRYKNSKKYILILSLFCFAVFLNIIPIKNIVTAPLWRTESTYRTIEIPEEYLEFTDYISKNITPNNIILSLPFGSSSYTVIKDENSNNVFLGTSPIVVFSGVSDISGYLSFNFTNEANIVDKLILDKKYDEFNKILFNHNVNFVAITKNIPGQVKNSYAFNKDVLNAQDKDFMSAIVGEKIYTSNKGNYELYTTKNRNSILKSKGLHFQRVNPTKFRLYIRGLKTKQDLSFIESYHGEWHLYLVKDPNLSFCFPRVIFSKFKTIECKEDFRIYDNDLSFIAKKRIFNNTHTAENNYSNKWEIDPEYIKENYDDRYYRINKDGSIDIAFDLYFRPQIYFYLGMGISIFVFVISIIYLFWVKKNEKNKK